MDLILRDNTLLDFIKTGSPLEGLNSSKKLISIYFFSPVEIQLALFCLERCDNTDLTNERLHFNLPSDSFHILCHQVVIDNSDVRIESFYPTLLPETLRFAYSYLGAKTILRAVYSLETGKYALEVVNIQPQTHTIYDLIPTFTETLLETGIIDLKDFNYLENNEKLIKHLKSKLSEALKKHDHEY